jgi:hypothetical protein
MNKAHQVREHEVAFCADVKSWVDALYKTHPDWSLSHAKIEQYGRGTNKRSDIRVFRRGNNTPVLAGEVKLPGTPEGRSPYAPELMQDAFNKADNIQAPYFFTWNVNTFVLFDRSKWNVPMIERRLRDWNLGLNLTSPGDCTRPEVQSRLRDSFLPSIFEYFSKIINGDIVEWGMPPDDVFIRSLESHLDWPVLGTRDFLISASQDVAFSTQLQSWMSGEMNWTFDPEDLKNWTETLERAARTLCYVFSNRAIFYEAIRAKYPGQLEELRMPRRGRHEHSGTYDYFRSKFQRAVQESGDYEPIFYPEVNDWAGALIFASDMANNGWTGLFRNLGEYNFRSIPYDIVGGIFRKLISPEERQKFGQFYTNEDVVDIVNAFCIRSADDMIIDPACGSGSFLVRGYHRKLWLSEQKKGGSGKHEPKEHRQLLKEIYGCDIALFAAHLATLNLAARQIKDEDNYPYIARKNFFEVPDNLATFCSVPIGAQHNGQKQQVSVALPKVDAVIGNPPYVRGEHIPKRSEIKRQKGETLDAYRARLKITKEYLAELCKELWPGLKLAGRSDLHCYFWPVAASVLKDDGYFGFLTSSNWLDAEYGFALQGWVLKNFKIVAVIESLDEPWFQDARIKTAITILQQCKDESLRSRNLVKFVRLFKPVKEILGLRRHADEALRQQSSESIWRLITQQSSPYSDHNLRIIPISQSSLWDEGVRAGTLLRGAKLPESTGGDEDENEDDGESHTSEAAAMYKIGSDYVAGKWGRFLRAPNFYFNVLQRFRSRFVRLGEIANVKRGITSGCDAFFMPRDVTEEVLEKNKDRFPWNDLGLMTPCKRSEVESGKVRIVRAGDNTLHPIETKYIRAEVHSLMDVQRPIIREKDVARVVLWVNEPLSQLSNTYAGKYIRWGAKQTFASKKSKSVPVPERSTCANRPIWYDLTGEDVGVSFWPKAHKYRHIVPANPDGMVCNCNLYTVVPDLKHQNEHIALAAILNSTIVALFKCFYGRYAGSEGTLKTEVVDTVLIEVPDPRGVPKGLAFRLSRALEKMIGREITHLVEDAMLQCHSVETMREILREAPKLPEELRNPDRRELDDCVFELLGVSDAQNRKELLKELYEATTEYYRYQRTQDIQAMENRSGKRVHSLGPHDIAEGIWYSIDKVSKSPTISEWIEAFSADTVKVQIPPGRARAFGSTDMFNPNRVIFSGDKDNEYVDYNSPEQATLAAELAKIGLRGEIELPRIPSDCQKCSSEILLKISQARERFAKLVGSRTGTPALQEKTTELLLHWFIQGRETK